MSACKVQYSLYTLYLGRDRATNIRFESSAKIFRAGRKTDNADSDVYVTAGGTPTIRFFS